MEKMSKIVERTYKNEKVISDKTLRMITGRSISRISVKIPSRIVLGGSDLVEYKRENNLIDRGVSHIVLQNEKSIKEMFQISDVLDEVKEKLNEYFGKDLTKYLRKKDIKELKANKKSKKCKKDSERVQEILKISEEISDVDFRTNILNITTKYFMENLR